MELETNEKCAILTLYHRLKYLSKCTPMYDLNLSPAQHMQGTYKNPLAVVGLGLIFVFTALETWVFSWGLPDMSAGLGFVVWSVALLATTISCRWLLRRTRLYFRDRLYGFPMFASRMPVRLSDYGASIMISFAAYLVGVRMLPIEWLSMPIYGGAGLMLFFASYALRAQDWRWVWLGLVALAAGIFLHQGWGELDQVGALFFAAMGTAVAFLGCLDMWRYKRNLNQIGGIDV